MTLICLRRASFALRDLRRGFLRRKAKHEGGMAALMLVMWMSLGLAGLMFSLSRQNASLLSSVRLLEFEDNARSAAHACRALLLVRLMEEPSRDLARLSGSFALGLGKGLPGLPRRTSCFVNALSGSYCHGLKCCEGQGNWLESGCSQATYGRIVSAHVTGIDSSSNVSMTYASEFFLPNDPPFLPRELSSGIID